MFDSAGDWRERLPPAVHEQAKPVDNNEDLETPLSQWLASPLSESGSHEMPAEPVTELSDEEPQAKAAPKQVKPTAKAKVKAKAKAKSKCKAEPKKKLPQKRQEPEEAKAVSEQPKSEALTAAESEAQKPAKVAKNATKKPAAAKAKASPDPEQLRFYKYLYHKDGTWGLRQKKGPQVLVVWISNSQCAVFEHC